MMSSLLRRLIFLLALLPLLASALPMPWPHWDLPLESYSLHRRAPAPAPSPDPANTTVNPAAVTGTTCGTPATAIVQHDINVAQLAICGGIAGTIEFCGGSPATTTGSSGTALFTLTAADAGATINVSKGRWEGCVRAAQAVCGAAPFSSTCVGGASTGDVAFTLAAQ